jgi:hypothetical protein
MLTVASTMVIGACDSPRDASASDSAAEIAITAGADTASQGGGTATTTKTSEDTARQGDGKATTKTPADTGMVALTAFGKSVSQMMAAMEAQMRVMDTASAATMQARIPRYERMADSLISLMNEEVRRANVGTDAIWPATVDSTRQDLGRIRAMPASDMKAAMPVHLKRMRWLIQMQRTMTGKTPP